MKSHVIPALKITFFLLLLLAVAYPTLVWSIAKLSSGGGEGQTLKHKANTYYSNIGQSFTQDRYFWSRPSAVGYNAAGSAGSNKGPSNEDYLAEVRERMNTLLAQNPGISISEIPVDLITASGSGLDPHFSVQAAKVQVDRIARIRQLPKDKLLALIDTHTERPLWEMLGPEKINVLKLNIALDNLSGSQSVR
ncbi:potassium-transporting ATPase subunit KdpC [Sphingobacterium deserti]|uniref:Potassium-transporting ATPase KdpC subunit n=1 Tax=Sphingobacterium deserti TaxID=1229276 RepID=A0A0B8T1K2_9SPHI|nr:potassium-transporting ATPase subunit KdpC [Sphingobacterium deserti]KGE12553.1 potassium-transporting ATPase subunit C [Sphingobacterium deserti]